MRDACISLSQLVSAFMDAYQLVLVHINLPQYIRKQAGKWARALAQLCHSYVTDSDPKFC